MNFNKLKIATPKNKKGESLRSSMLKASPSRNNFANTINLSSQMSQPEDQGSYGTCVSWASTTFIESLLWKLTGQKEEFTVDEVYNLYLDAYGYDLMIDRYFPVTAEQRKRFRGGNGSWGNIPAIIGDAGLWHADDNRYIFNDSSEEQQYVYYWIVHYNDPEVRKNHYPDRFSPLCEKAKNYIYRNLYTKFLGDYTGNVNVVDPLDVKDQLNKFGMPVCASLLGNSGGHQVVCTVAERNTFRFDSSWNDQSIYYITIEYDKTIPGYYTNTSYSGLQYVNGIDYYYPQSNRNKLTLLSSLGGYAYGAEDQDRFLSTISLIAIPDDGKYFDRWICTKNGIQSEYLTNPCQFDMSCDISVQAVFADSPNLATTYTLNIQQPDIGSVIGAVNGQTFTYNSSIILTVVPGEDGEFVSWNDGNTDNPRTFSMTENRFAFPIVKAVYDPSTTVIRMFDSNLMQIAYAEAPDGKEISADFGE